MSKSIIAAMATGYLAVAVQAFIGLLLVPFLLSEHGVGLAGFGTIATVQAVVFIPAILLDGYRQDAARRIANSIATNESGAFLGLVTFTVALTATIAGLFVALAQPLSAFLGLETDIAIPAFCLAALTTVPEQYSYLLESGLHAARRSSLAQLLGVADAIVRASLVVTLFLVERPSVSGYFAMVLLALSAKAIVLTTVSPIKVGRLGNSSKQILRTEAIQFKRSVPLSLNALAPYLVFRVSVILGNKMLGAEAAGVLALILVTLRGYLNQATFTALRPMLIPRLATANLADPRSQDSQRLGKYLAAYNAALYTLGIAAVCATPVWVTLWLGTSLSAYAPYFTLALAVYVLEVASGIQYYCLVAHSKAKSLAKINGAAALVGAALLAGCSGLISSLWMYVVVVACYLVTYAGLVRYYFRREIGLPTRTIDAQTLLAGCIALLGCTTVFVISMEMVKTLATALAAATLFLAACLKFRLVDLGSVLMRNSIRSIS